MAIEISLLHRSSITHITVIDKYYRCNFGIQKSGHLECFIQLKHISGSKLMDYVLLIGTRVPNSHSKIGVLYILVYRYLKENNLKFIKKIPLGGFFE